jgi:uncharacterized glyoxalase superfamily protein PhnB
LTTENKCSIIPIFRIFDESKAREFYLDFLGFKVNFEHRFEDGFPIYLEVQKGDWVLHLSEHHGDCCPGAAIMLHTNKLKSYQESLLAKAYKNSRPGCEQTEWNTLEMCISDPFGNKLTFFERLE